MCTCGGSRHAVELRPATRLDRGARWAGPSVRAAHAPGFCRQVVAATLLQLPRMSIGPGGCDCASQRLEEVDDPEEARRGFGVGLQAVLCAPAVFMGAILRALLTSNAGKQVDGPLSQLEMRGLLSVAEATVPKQLPIQRTPKALSLRQPLGHEGSYSHTYVGCYWLRIPAQALIAAAALWRALREATRAETQQAAVKSSFGSQSVVLAQVSLRDIASRCTALLRARTQRQGIPLQMVPLGCDEMALLASIAHAIAYVGARDEVDGTKFLMRPMPPTPGSLERGSASESSASDVLAMIASHGIRVPWDTLARALAVATTVRVPHHEGHCSLLSVPPAHMLLSLPPPSKACGASLCTALALARACDMPRGYVSCRLNAGALAANGETRADAVAGKLNQMLLPTTAAAVVETK